MEIRIHYIHPKNGDAMKTTCFRITLISVYVIDIILLSLYKGFLITEGELGLSPSYTSRCFIVVHSLLLLVFVVECLVHFIDAIRKSRYKEYASSLLTISTFVSSFFLLLVINELVMEGKFFEILLNSDRIWSASDKVWLEHLLMET